MTTPADQLRAAEERVRMGDRRIDIALRGPIAELLDVASDLATAYPEMAHDHDRPACDDYACDLMGAALAVARQILGTTEQPDTIGLCGHCGVPRESHHHGYVSTADVLAAEPGATAQPDCVHPEGYEGECPCPPSCACCQPTAAACACGKAGTPGVVHRTDGPCYMAEQPDTVTAATCSAGLLPFGDAPVERCVVQGFHVTHRSTTGRAWETEQPTPAPAEETTR